MPSSACAWRRPTCACTSSSATSRARPRRPTPCCAPTAPTPRRTLRSSPRWRRSPDARASRRSTCVAAARATCGRASEVVPATNDAFAALLMRAALGVCDDSLRTLPASIVQTLSSYVGPTDRQQAADALLERPLSPGGAVHRAEGDADGQPSRERARAHPADRGARRPRRRAASARLAGRRRVPACGRGRLARLHHSGGVARRFRRRPARRRRPSWTSRSPRCPRSRRSSSPRR